MAKRGKVSNLYEDEAEERPVRFKRYKQLFLIVCEDENTEPAYFEKFKSRIKKATIFLRPVGTGRDAKGVVERAIIEREILAKESRMEVDVVYVVFDKDDANENTTKTQRFNDAFTIAAEQNIKVAYSNEAFELWFLLHLTAVDHHVALPRQTIYDMLQDKIRLRKNYTTFKYQHGNADIVNIISIIGDEENAIARAELLLQKHGTSSPIFANPSTKVHLLVNELNEWIEFYNYEPE